MPDRIPIQAAKDIAAKCDCRQVVLVAWDGTSTHVVTYGKSVEDADQAAQGGNHVKKALGWPESLQHAEPSRVRKLRARIRELEAALQPPPGMKKPGAVLICDNLNVAFFDATGEQVPEMQGKNVAVLLCEAAEKRGFDMEGAVIETPGGKWRMFKNEDFGWRREAV